MLAVLWAGIHDALFGTAEQCPWALASATNHCTISIQLSASQRLQGDGTL